MKQSLFVFVAALLLGCASRFRTPNGGLVAKPLNYGDISRLLRNEVRVSDVYIHSFQRDSLGTSLFINFSYRKGDDESFWTAMVTREGINTVPALETVLYDDSRNRKVSLESAVGHYDEAGRLSWRFGGARYDFQNGPTIPYARISGIKDVAGGPCILIKISGESQWWLVAVENPMQPMVRLPANLNRPERASLTDDGFIVLGRANLPSGDNGVCCLVYRKSQLGYTLSQEISLPWASGVYDFNQNSGDVLARGTAQMFAGYYRFNIPLKERTRLGFAPADDVLFLKEDVVRVLDVAIQRIK